MFSLKGKTALVTGAAKGIGKGIALVLAEAGANIIINDIHEGEEVEALLNEIEAKGVSASFIKADVTSEDKVKSLFQSIETSFGSLDILVNNAGTSRSQTIFETSLEDWNQIINTNLTSCFLCSKEAMELMSKNKFGRIVNISSVVGEQGALYGHVHYAATKSGILGITKTLARTGADLGITVNAIAPGIIETELLMNTHGEEGVKKLQEKAPFGLGKPRDIGLTVAFLCSGGGNYITGATIDVNGGMYMR